MKKGKSKYDYLSHKYEFPGGKIECGETPKVALIRELKEEMNADISSATISLFNEMEYHYPDFSVHLFVFIVRVSDFIFTLKEHESYVWTRTDQLSDLDWVDADKQIINNLRVFFNE